MAIVITDDKHYQNIASKIRETTGKTDTMLLPSQMPQKIGEVYEAGQKSEYDRFWDAFQENGNRTNYECGFAGKGWTLETFKPKYDIKPIGAYMMFRSVDMRVDLDTLLENAGIVLDFSGCKIMTYAFNASLFNSVGTIDCSSATNVTGIFATDSLKTIKKFVPPAKEMGASDFGAGLANITVDGTITESINFQKCPLTPESMMSIIRCLKNFWLEDAENLFSRTLHFSEECWDALNEKYPTSSFGSPNPDWKSEVQAEYGWSV